MNEQESAATPPPLPGSLRNIEAASHAASGSKTRKKTGLLHRWFWAPIRHNENWAQTVFRVFGNLFRIALTIFIAFVAFVASVGGYFFAKENHPEWFGANYLTEWCDDQYDNQYYKHERSEKVCSARWAEYDKFIAACNAAERQTRNLLRTDCQLPARPSFQTLNSMYGYGKSAFGSDPISSAGNQRDRLKSTLAYQLSQADLQCKYATSQFDKRNCQLATETVNETEAQLAQLEELIKTASSENDEYEKAERVCLVARIARSQEVRPQVVEAVSAADRLGVGLNIDSCAARAKEWAPSIYSPK
ncbi:MAG: hypothetical protein R3B98_02110 [Hyphomonas sp.]